MRIRFRMERDHGCNCELHDVISYRQEESKQFSTPP